MQNLAHSASFHSEEKHTPSINGTKHLRRASHDLLRGDVVRSIISRTGGHIGEILAMLRAAAIVAIETGEEEISDRTLRMAPYRGPLERRTIVERQVLSGR